MIVVKDSPRLELLGTSLTDVRSHRGVFLWNRWSESLSRPAKEPNNNRNQADQGHYLGYVGEPRRFDGGRGDCQELGNHTSQRSCQD